MKMTGEQLWEIRSPMQKNIIRTPPAQESSVMFMHVIRSQMTLNSKQVSVLMDLPRKKILSGRIFSNAHKPARVKLLLDTVQGLTWLNENTLTYNKTWKEKHNINAVAGFTTQKFNNESLFAYAFDFPDGRTGYHDISAGLLPQKSVNNESQWSLVSYLGRVNYTLSDKYLFTVTGRADGSSKFAEGNKYGFFPSGAFAWRVSKEEFMSNIAAISDLKLRVSYGVIGNQAIPPYQSLALVGPYGQGVFNSSTGNEVYTGLEPLKLCKHKPEMGKHQTI